MTDAPAAPTTDNNPDLFDLAAKLAGCEPVDLLRVRTEQQGLVVILLTGQKFVFNIFDVSTQLDAAIRAQLSTVLGIDMPAEPAPATKPAPKKRAR